MYSINMGEMAMVLLSWARLYFGASLFQYTNLTNLSELPWV